MEHEVRFTDYRFELATGRLWHGPNEVRLTPKEFDLFVYMARHPNRVLTHAAPRPRPRIRSRCIDDERSGRGRPLCDQYYVERRAEHGESIRSSI